MDSRKHIIFLLARVLFSDGGKIVTMFLLLFGVGSLAFAAHAFIESMIEVASNPVLIS